MIAYCSSPDFVKHRTTPGHPERAERVVAIEKAVGEMQNDECRMQNGTQEDPHPNPPPEYKGRGKALMRLKPVPIDEEILLWVHSGEYVEHVREVCEGGGGNLDEDTSVSRESFEIAKLSAGGVIAICDAVMGGNVKRGFSAGRPPGHHALPDRTMGFCLFGNIALGAKYLQRKFGLGRIAIVDFDVHHGNGTQAIFESDATVLFVSMHQDPRTLWPGSGFADEVGVGAGRGFTVNVPLMPGADDEVYLRVMEEKVLPRVLEYGPEALLISAGFDAHRDDPLAQMRMSEAGFYEMTRRLCAAADDCCGGRVISALEGGYNLEALGDSVVAHLRGLGAT